AAATIDEMLATAARHEPGGETAARSSGDGLLAVGVVVAVGGGAGFFGGVLRLFGGIGRLLGRVGEILATGHVVARGPLAGDVGAGVGGRIGCVGSGLRGLRGGHVASGLGVLRGLPGLGGRVGGLLGGGGGLVGIAARGQAGNQGQGEQGLGDIHGSSCGG